ncbi:retrovirus-related Pol polyprotein from transposon 17.6 [Trichonephila clavipes]|uniref:Retrovirus-related Pol polyprotein from transposon 17.6 n=1 Tax=Trichonephila clavipes TaxID=2585209 RepID=A0A8X6RKJ9_TRICX|nr:retrovirus-related Pol polyprotein from transposon 17.6 [Trichonephila clavipes]
MKECQLKRKTWYDRDVVERKFVEGDLVMVLVTSKQNKLEVNWIGPGKIDELKQVITKKIRTCFPQTPGTTHLMRMDIELISDKPIKTKPYRMSPRQINILREEIKRLLELGVIEIGQSDYTSPLILVESPNKDPRPCVDYRRLNEITRAEFFPLPNMEEIVENTIASPLTDALKGKIKKEKITWDEKCGKAFEELKAKLVTQPILFAPDFATEFILQTDARPEQSRKWTFLGGGVVTSSMGVNPIFQVTIGFMVLPAGQGQVPHPSIVPECFTINQLWNDRCTWPWGHCLLSELRE